MKNYNFGSQSYTDKNMTPTDIQDLAFAYAQAPIGKLVGKKLDHIIRTSNDLAKLTGGTQKKAGLQPGNKALILILLKNKLVTTQEYKDLYNALIKKHADVIKYLINSSPEMRGTGGDAARAAARDMKGHFDTDESVVNESSIPKQIRALIDTMIERKVQRHTARIKDEKGFNQFMKDVKPAVDQKMLMVKRNPIDDKEFWISLGPKAQIFGESTNEDEVSGGLADGMSLQDVANKHKIDIDELLPEFKMGFKVEREHTDNPKIAGEIALDHLFEDPKYYTKLDKMENENCDDDLKESQSGVQKVVKHLKKQMSRGYIQKHQIDQDAIYGAMSQLGIKLSDNEVDDVEFELNESVNEGTVTRTAAEIAYYTGTNKQFVQDFIDKHDLDIEKIFQYVKKGGLKQRMEFVSAVAGKPGNKIQKMILSKFKNESVNEGLSVTDERHFGKNGIIIMIDQGNGKITSAIFKNKSNADKFNRNKESDLKKLLALAEKTPYPKAIDESVNEAQQLNPDSKKFLKGMKKIKVKGLGGWMPGVDYVYKDEKNGDIYADYGGNHAKVTNIATLKQLKKDGLIESVNEAGDEPATIADLRWIVKNHQHKKVRDPKTNKLMQIDATTANLLVNVYDHLKKSENKEKFLSLGLRGMTVMAWKMVK